MTLEATLVRPAPAVPAPAQPAPAPAPRKAPARIRDDAHAIEVARKLAADFEENAVPRDRERVLPWAELDRFSASGLWSITVPVSYTHLTLPTTERV